MKGREVAGILLRGGDGVWGDRDPKTTTSKDRGPPSCHRVKAFDTDIHTTHSLQAIHCQMHAYGQ